MFQIKRTKELLIIFYIFLNYFALNSQNVTYIDLSKAKFEEINAEKLFEEFEIVPLETHKDGLLKIRDHYYLTKKYIIAVTPLTAAYLFDRKTGAFIREISSFGQGPDEYAGMIYERYGFDEKNNIIFASDGVNIGGSWKCINIETNRVESTIKRPLPENDKEIFYVCAPWLIKNNIYLSFSNNRSGKDNVRLIVFDIKGNVIKKYPHYLEYKKINNTFPGNNGIFYYYNEDTYFKEFRYNDTVFSVSEFNMSPHIIFESGDKQPSYYHQEDDEYNKGKYLIDFVYESDLFVLFNFVYYTETMSYNTPIGNSISGKAPATHTGLYDKKNKQA